MRGNLGPRSSIDAYVTLAIIIIAILVVLYLPVLFILRKKGKPVIRQLGYLLFFCSCFLIVFATIIFSGIDFTPVQYVFNSKPLLWLEEPDRFRRLTSEVIPNVMMFIPLGIFAPVVFSKMRKLYRTALLAFVISLSVECLQYFIGRSSDIDDLLANLAGGMIGYCVFKIFASLLQNKTWWKKFTGQQISTE